MVVVVATVSLFTVNIESTQLVAVHAAELGAALTLPAESVNSPALTTADMIWPLTEPGVHTNVAGGPAAHVGLPQFAAVTSPCTKSATAGVELDSVKVNVTAAAFVPPPDVSDPTLVPVAVIVTVGAVVSLFTINADVTALALPAASAIAETSPVIEIAWPVLAPHVSVYA
jgi:hypothetical protein